MASRQSKSVLSMLASSLLRGPAVSRACTSLPCSLVVRTATAPVTTRAFAVRALHTSLAPQSSGLISALQAELDFEKEEYSQPPEVAGGPPGDFTLTESQGDCLVTLTKESGNEVITVELVAGSESEDVEEGEYVGEEEEEGEEVPLPPATPFSVSVAKGETELRFELRVRGDGSLQVDEVTLTPVDEDDEAFSELPYQGPRFQELDEALQSELLHYLDERGINADLAVYITALNFDKEQREYTQWLERVQAFVGKQ